MTPLLSRAQTRAFDARAIEVCGVPSLLLMENAGRGAAEVAERELLGGDPAGARVVVVCGGGNNGGDGLVIARRLAVRGARPAVVLAHDAGRLPPDAQANLVAWRGIGGEVRQVAAAPLTALHDALRGADLVVDALFGTGLDRALEGFAADVVRAINAASAPVLAVDLPSGLDADTGAALGVAVRARVTATFAHPKIGLYTPGGALLAGRVVVVDIGVPPTLVTPEGATATLLERADVARWRPARPPGAHKTTGGHVLVLGGSRGKLGAPQLAARGALRAGAGVATIASWPDAAAAIETGTLETMVARLAPDDLEASLRDALQGKHAVVVGPGLGLGPETRAVVERLLAVWTGPLVVDADALTTFEGTPGALDAGSGKTILTPHPGELGRLAGKTPAQVEADRVGVARAMASTTGAVVVLKGAHTVVADPDGRTAVSPIACPALATAGSGDVLGGVIAAVACAQPRFESACAGVILHAMAGESWSRAHRGADRGMLASEIADAILEIE